LEKKADSVARYYDELKEAKAKFVVEKRALEAALRDAQPGEDEAEARHALIYQIEELQANLVGAARHGFDNAID